MFIVIFCQKFFDRFSDCTHSNIRTVYGKHSEYAVPSDNVRDQCADDRDISMSDPCYKLAAPYRRISDVRDFESVLNSHASALQTPTRT